MTVNEISDNFSLLDGWVVQNLYYRWSKEFLEAGKTGSQGFSPAYRNCYPNCEKPQIANSAATTRPSTVRQNQGIIEFDVRDRPLACSAYR